MMAKISSILPSNKRITSTDIANERPVRPGTPSFGAPIAQTASPKNEFRKIELDDEPEAEFSNYGSDGKITGEVKLKNDIDAVDRVNEGFKSEIDVRA
jgi:hypothetical protein